MQIDGSFLHVKWFIGDETGKLLSMAEVLSYTFLFWLGVTLIGLLLSAIFNEPLQRVGIVQRVHAILDRAKPYATVILRVGLGIGLLMQLFSAKYLAPEFDIHEQWIRIILIIAILGLFSKRSLIVSGAALAVLYATTIAEFGLFHALDYLFYAGIIYYLLVSQTQWKATATPALYLFTGLSLAWVGIEKMVLPSLAIHIVEHNGIPTFGFPVEDFVLISAFIELGLAWTFIVGILNRFISIIVTLVFITTTTVFGMTEVIGHTILHTLLIMFLIEGEGAFKTPFQFHRKPVLRYLFVLVNFCVLLFGAMYVYIWMGSA